MAMSELEKLLIGGLKACGLDFDTVNGMIDSMPTEVAKWSMVNFIQGELDRTDTFPDKASVTKAWGQILDRFPPPDVETEE